MEEVIHYLELKNQYYEKFHAMTCKFLEQARENRWDDLDFFVDNRERILNIIRSYDFKIAKLFEEQDLTKLDLHVYRPRVKSLLESREQWVKKIVAVDLELVSKIDEMKSETIRDLKRSVETNHQLNAFSTSNPRPTPKTKEV